MNPLPINTVNVIQFGFATTFDLEASKLIFDIGGFTVFNPGGAARVLGINFQVIDPSGTEISTISWPDKQIDPSTGQTVYNVNLSSVAFQFGWYKIVGVLREADGTDYTITISKNICAPRDYSNGLSKANIEQTVDCGLPQILISERTNLLYQGRNPDLIEKQGMIYFPQDVNIQTPYNYTPFSIAGSGNVYTGSYVVRHRTDATYDMDDLVKVRIRYAATLKFSVTCNSNLCEILCCVQNLQSVAAGECSTEKGRHAKDLLDKVTMPLLVALTLEKCGQSSGDLVSDIAKTLGCDCNCDSSEMIEAKPILSGNTPITLRGECATDVTPDGSTYVIKTKNVKVQNGDTGDLALKIEKKDTNCDTTYLVTLDKNRLTGDILNIISTNPEYKAVFNTLVNNVGIDLSGVDGRCIIDTDKCDYDLIADAQNNSKTVQSILIDGNTYGAPAGLVITNSLGIQTWLNSLSKGIFTSYFDSTTKTTVIKSQQNTSAISSMTFIQNGINYVQQFSKSCGRIVAFLQGIIDYLCDLTDKQVHLSQSYTICTLNAKGEIKEETVAPSNTASVATVLTKMAASLCASLRNVLQQAGLSCQSVQKVFADTQSQIKTTDVLYGTRSDNCGKYTSTDVLRMILTEITTTNNQELIDLWCQANKRCVLPTCEPIGYMELVYIEPCPAVTGIIGTFS
ncbi:hypothetical protein PV783_34245 [Chitinophaga sp. CC14]|uniref:hypothetical protein n=1 Tax=Chitinophaga sp. CC14 TaxID=3029199 RepID=UPI003B7F4C34